VSIRTRETSIVPLYLFKLKVCFRIGTYKIDYSLNLSCKFHLDWAINSTIFNRQYSTALVKGMEKRHYLLFTTICLFPKYRVFHSRACSIITFIFSDSDLVAAFWSRAEQSREEALSHGSDIVPTKRWRCSLLVHLLSLSFLERALQTLTLTSC